MKIFIDTNIFFQEQFFRSTTAAAFLKAARLLGFEILIPEIVIDEIKGNYASRFEEKVKQLEKAFRELAKITDLEELDIFSEDGSADYNIWLDNLLDEHDVIIIPYPTTPLKEIVEASYTAKKPYKENGEGHKDYIIWKTILSTINSFQDAEEFIFLTDNIKDFCTEDNGQQKLHTQLVQQINKADNIPQIYRSIKRLFDEKMKPSFVDVELNDIPNLSLEELDHKVKDILNKELEYYSAYGFAGLTFSNDVTVVNVNESSISNTEYTDLGDDILITVTGIVSLEVHGFTDKINYYSDYEFKKEKGYYVIDEDWNDWVAAVGATLDTPFQLALSYSKELKEITKHTITLTQEVEDDYYS